MCKKKKKKYEGNKKIGFNTVDCNFKQQLQRWRYRQDKSLGMLDEHCSETKDRPH